MDAELLMVETLTYADVKLPRFAIKRAVPIIFITHIDSIFICWSIVFIKTSVKQSVWIYKDACRACLLLCRGAAQLWRWDKYARNNSPTIPSLLSAGLDWTLQNTHYKLQTNPRDNSGGGDAAAVFSYTSRTMRMIPGGKRENIKEDHKKDNVEHEQEETGGRIRGRRWIGRWKDEDRHVKGIWGLRRALTWLEACRILERKGTMAHSTDRNQKMKRTPEDWTPRNLSNWIRNVASSWDRSGWERRGRGAELDYWGHARWAAVGVGQSVM